MIGLKKGTVKLVPHDPKWKKEFEREEKRLAKQLGDLAVAIEHIGSTSISGIYAKPILDIDVGARTIKDFPKFTQALKPLGYERIKNSNSPNSHFVYKKVSQGKIIHFLHLVKYEGATWNHHIAFRDYLRTHKQRALAYSNLKRKLAKEFPDNRPEYTNRKDTFLKKILRR